MNVYVNHTSDACFTLLQWIQGRQLVLRGAVYGCGTAARIRRGSLPWMISNDVVEFPLYNRLKTEKMVYEMHPPTPRKDFKKYKIVLIQWTGT